MLITLFSIKSNQHIMYKSPVEDERSFFHILTLVSLSLQQLPAYSLQRTWVCFCQAACARACEVLSVLSSQRWFWHSQCSQLLQLAARSTQWFRTRVLQQTPELRTSEWLGAAILNRNTCVCSDTLARIIFPFILVSVKSNLRQITTHPQGYFFFPPSCQIQNIKLEREGKPQKALMLVLPNKYVALLKSRPCNSSAVQLAEWGHL